MKAGFIGYRNFAEKLRCLFKDSGFVTDFLFYNPLKPIRDKPYTNKLNDLFGCNFIVIASPDWTHGSYIRQLQDYNGYIFCEKIPVITREDLLFLKNNQNHILYFDFNYRKSILYELLKRYEDKILYIDHHLGHGIALEEKYKDSWRSSRRYAPLGVFQLSGIHFFDLLVFCYGKPSSYRITARNISPYGDSYDNFAISLEFQNKIIADLFISYTSPYQFNFNIITNDQLIELSRCELIIRGPRETYDEKGLFTLPPVITHKKSNFLNVSLKNSIEYFLSIVKARKVFPEASLKHNLLSTELFLDILDELELSKS